MYYKVESIFSSVCISAQLQRKLQDFKLVICGKIMKLKNYIKYTKK